MSAVFRVDSAMGEWTRSEAEIAKYDGSVARVAVIVAGNKDTFEIEDVVPKATTEVAAVGGELVLAVIAVETTNAQRTNKTEINFSSLITPPF